jgi:glycosyltransferase involved in cell wall biosynthesis
LGQKHRTDGKPTKILYIHHTFRNQSGSFLLWNIAKRIDKNKYQVFAACLREGGPYEDKLRRIGVQVKNFDLKTLVDIRIIPRLVSYIKQNSIDIVETSVFPADVYGRISARLANVPIIISTMHCVEAHKLETMYRILFFADTLTMALTTRTIAVSKAVKNYLISWHRVKSDKIRVVYNGMAAHKYDSNIDINEYKRKLNLQHDIPTVVFIGRLVKLKGVGYFLKAAAMVIRSGKKAQFLVVGDGPLKQSLVKQTQKLGIDQHVFFTGFREDIPKILSCIDILVLPSLWEGLPLTILEAMHAGKPIIATRVGGIPEAVRDRETGILIPPRDCHALTKGIVELLKDPEKCKEMGEKGKERALQHFNVERMVKEYSDIYDECIVSQLEGGVQ